MKIGVVGYGYVGKAMTRFFKLKYDVIYYDPYVETSCTKQQINECDMACICVPTNMAADGSCDTSIVESVLEWVDTPLILIKSTVDVGFTRKQKEKTGKRIVFSPEYIGEGTYDHGKYDFNQIVERTPFYIFGGDPADTDKAVSIFVPICGPSKTYRQTNETCAEMAKYMENSYLATKVLFSYEFDQLCKAHGISYHEVRDAWLLDPRMEPSHTVIFPENDYPFGGKCLPKDVNAIVQNGIKNGYHPEFLAEVLKSNERIKELRSKQK